MIVRNDKGEPLYLACDMTGCDTRAPERDVVLRGGGLINMGWWCKGGRHMCPAHHPDKPL